MQADGLADRSMRANRRSQTEFFGGSWAYGQPVSLVETDRVTGGGGHNRWMVLDVALVGTGGMMPLPNRWLSSVLVRYQGRLILFDCGEGTQISLRGLGWGLKDIDLILISHVHGDHVTGLPGLLLTLANSERTDDVLIVGPPGFSDVVERLLVVAPHLPFEVRMRELRDGNCFESAGLMITCCAAEHHVACLAYRIDLPRGRRFLPERAREL